MRMHEIKIFFIFVPNLRETYLFDEKSFFSKTKAHLAPWQPNKTGIVLERILLIVKGLSYSCFCYLCEAVGSAIFLHVLVTPDIFILFFHKTDVLACIAIYGYFWQQTN